MTDQSSRCKDLGCRFEERQERSCRFLEKIDQLEAEIAAGNEQAQRNKLQREIADIRRQFAEHLGDLNYIHGPSMRTVQRTWLISGVCSKQHREQARQWMKARFIDWDGATPALRHQVRKALERSEQVPDGNFGLHVERSVDIKPPRTIIVNQFGKSRQVAVPANEQANAEIKAEKAFVKLMRARISHNE